MDLEQIKREVLGRETKRLLDVALPTIECLARQSRDQIETHVRKIRIAQISKSSQRIRGVMRAAEFREFGVIECLRAETGPVNSETPKCAQFVRGRTSRIDLERDLSLSRDLKLVVQNSENALELRRGKQRRRAASKINRVNSPPNILPRPDLAD